MNADVLDVRRTYEYLRKSNTHLVQSSEIASQGRTSFLSGRVICLPYRVESIFDSLYDTDLVELKSGLTEDKKWSLVEL